VKDAKGVKSSMLTIPKFLNRLLGLPTALQNQLFQFFVDEHDRQIAQAKKDGKFDDGVVDIKGTISMGGEPTELFKDPASGAPTKLVSLSVDQGLPWAAALEAARGPHGPQTDDHELQPGDQVTVKGWAGGDDEGPAAPYEAAVWKIQDDGQIQVVYREIDGGNFQTIGSKDASPIPPVRFFRHHYLKQFGSEKAHPVLVASLLSSSTNPEGFQNPVYKIFRPGTGANAGSKKLSELQNSYQRAAKDGSKYTVESHVEITAAEAEGQWNMQYEALAKNCIHGPNAKCGGYPTCTVGSRCRQFQMLCGAILPVWSAIRPVFQSLGKQRDSLSDESSEGTGGDGAAKVPLARIEYQDSTGHTQRLVGVKVANAKAQKAVVSCIESFKAARNGVLAPPKPPQPVARATAHSQFQPPILNVMDIVQLWGLPASHQQLNGLMGRIVIYQEQEARYVVMLNNGTQLAIVRNFLVFKGRDSIPKKGLL